MCTSYSTVNYQGPRWLQVSALAVLNVFTVLHASLLRLASKICSIGVMVQLQLATLSGKHVPKRMHRPLLPLFHHNPRLAHAMMQPAVVAGKKGWGQSIYWPSCLRGGGLGMTKSGPSTTMMGAQPREPMMQCCRPVWMAYVHDCLHSDCMLLHREADRDRSSKGVAWSMPAGSEAVIHRK